MKKLLSYLFIPFSCVLTPEAFSQVVCDSSVYSRLHPTLVATGSNMIFNPGFELGNFNYWKDEAFGMAYYPVPTTFAYANPALTIASGVGIPHTGTYAAKLNLPSNPNLDHVEVRQSLPTLKTGGTYTLTAWIRAVNATVPTVNFNISLLDNRGHWARQTITAPLTYNPTTTYQLVTWIFAVPATAAVPAGAPLKWMDLNLQVLVSAGGIYLDDVQINAIGGEWSPISSSKPTAQPGFTEDFTGTTGTPLNTSRWLVSQKQWGGANQGVVPENLELQCGLMRFHGHGSAYAGSVVGEDGITKTLAGSAIATKEYYASGQYDVVAKLAPGGIVSAFWPYHYIEDATYGFDFPNGWATIQNTEIDWEFPSNIRCNGTISTTPAIFDANCNTYGSKCDGTNIASSPAPYDPYSTGYSYRKNISAVTGADAAAAYHIYTIKWHSGGGGVTPSVEWLIDGISIQKETRPHYVPYRAARFWIGVWYGKACWSGAQNHSDIFMDVKSVTVTPYNEVNDRYESESDPFVGYAPLPFYPLYPVGCAALPVNLVSFSGACINNSTDLKWATSEETGNSFFTVENSSDGISFQAIANVNGNGNSNTIKTYTYKDFQKKGNYYRLKQTDSDGKSTFSNTIHIECAIQDDDIKIWKADDDIKLYIENKNGDNSISVELYSLTGQIVLSQNFKLETGNNLFTLHHNFSQAIYIARIIKGNQIVTKKIGI
jgi:hypothetical protein